MSGPWARVKRFSIWRVPNYFIEPRGAFLGEKVEAVERLNKFRSWAAIAIIAGATVYYAGLSHLGTITKGRNGVDNINIGAHNPEGNWFVGLLISVVTAMFVLPLVSLYLVYRTKPGSRRAALAQLRWPLVAVAAWFGILALASPFIALGDYLEKSSRHLNFDFKAVAWVLVVFILVLELTWIVKAIYLAATGLFRRSGRPSTAPAYRHADRRGDNRAHDGHRGR